MNRAPVRCGNKSSSCDPLHKQACDGQVAASSKFGSTAGLRFQRRRPVAFQRAKKSPTAANENRVAAGYLVADVPLALEILSSAGAGARRAGSGVLKKVHGAAVVLIMASRL